MTKQDEKVLKELNIAYREGKTSLVILEPISEELEAFFFKYGEDVIDLPDNTILIRWESK